MEKRGGPSSPFLADPSLIFSTGPIPKIGTNAFAESLESQVHFPMVLFHKIIKHFMDRTWT
jgi:hypothetical protein